jgi:hypothetical protein
MQPENSLLSPISHPFKSNQKFLEFASPYPPPSMGEGAGGGGQNEIWPPLTFILSRQGRGDISGFVNVGRKFPELIM